MSTTVAISRARSWYTAARTHVASRSTRCETQAPFSTNASAAASCRTSSRVTSRTRTFASTARMPPLYVRPNAPFELSEPPGVRRTFRKHRPVHVLRRESSSTPYDDLLPLLVPFQNGTRSDSELLSH